MFVVEGERLYGRALASGLVPQVTFVSEDGLGAVGEIVSVAPEVLDKASYRDRSQGVIGVFPQFETHLEGIEVSEVPLLLVVEGIEKPGNLGAMLRTAAAGGVDAVIAVGSRIDVFNPNALRSSTGAVFTVPIAVSSWQEVGPWLAGRGLGVVATSPDADTTLWDVDLSGPTAVLIGAEDVGLTAEAMSQATQTVSIPQHDGTTDSLNASVAAGIVLFEVVRQRGG